METRERGNAFARFLILDTSLLTDWTTLMTQPSISEATAILRFVQDHPDACDHVVDLPYRLCSPSAQDERNFAVWRDDAGGVIGFAILQLQFSTVDWAVAPGHGHLTNHIFSWTLDRLHAVRAERDPHYGFLLGSHLADDPAITALGFADDEWSMLHLSMPLPPQPIQPAALEGIRIRPLAGLPEADAYVSLHRAAFQTRNMSLEWRTRILAHPAYQPSLDLVAEDETGKLVAFCVGWADEVAGVKTGQIEPLGVLPEAQKRGIGRAILLTVLARMQAMGCQSVRIDAESANPASTHLYESVGFTEFARTYQYFRQVR